MRLRCSFRHALASASAVAAMLIVPALAVAQEAKAGTVVQIDHDDLVLDLGSQSGLVEGDVVEIWRPIKVKHPVTGKMLVDRFKIGALQIGQVRPHMSLATPSGNLTRDPETGDVVVLPPKTSATSVKETPSGAPPQSEPAPPASSVDPEATEVAAMFDSLKGKDPTARIRRYEAYVRMKPNGRFALVLYEEAAALRQLVLREKGSNERRPEPEVASFARPGATIEGTPLRVAIELNAFATGAVVHVRRRGDVAYRSFPMARVGGAYFAATIPGELVVAPSLELFIEATGEREVVPVVAQEGAPLRVEVNRLPRPTSPPHLPATVSLLTDYADYNRLKGNDRVWQTEGYFGVRFGDLGVRALRSGFGVFRGVGGSLVDLDVNHLAGRSVGLTYGYLETEIAVVHSFSFIGRGVIGLLDSGVSAGGQLLVRIGNDRGTNLVLGGEVLGGIGLKSITELQWNSFPRFPILLRTEVTNQPAGTTSGTRDPTVSQGESDIAARGIVELGYRPVPSLTLAIRGSGQGRNIKHAGPGFGGAVSYEW